MRTVVAYALGIAVFVVGLGIILGLLLAYLRDAIRSFRWARGDDVVD